MPKNLTKEINNEYFLVCVDESDEFKSALEYACENAQKQKINLILLYIIYYYIVQKFLVYANGIEIVILNVWVKKKKIKEENF